MKVYCYDLENVFVGEIDADICQVTELKRLAQVSRGLKEGEEEILQKFILPFGATFEKPVGELSEGEIFKFENGSWIVFKIPVEEPKEPEETPEPTYQELRAMEYPDLREYLDGMVKMHSPDPLIVVEGTNQVDKYVADCLAVKAKYPKP